MTLAIATSSSSREQTALSAADAPEPRRGLELAVQRACRYLETGIPDLVWCEFPNADREPTERFATEVRKRFPEARFVFNWSRPFKWHTENGPSALDGARRHGLQVPLHHTRGHSRQRIWFGPTAATHATRPAAGVYRAATHRIRGRRGPADAQPSFGLGRRIPQPDAG